MKHLKLGLLNVLKLLGVFALMRHLTRRGVRILCYHGVWLGDEGFPGDAMFMKRETFESRLEHLRRWGFPIVTLDDALAGLSDGGLPPCPVVITIDDGWYSTFSVMLPALKRQGMPATLYCDTAHLLSDKPVPHVMARYFMTIANYGHTGRLVELDQEDALSLLFQSSIKLEGDIEERMDTVRSLAQMLSIDSEYYEDKKVFHYMLPEQLVEAYKDGLNIQLHTHNHSMHDMSVNAVVTEIEENRRWLSKILDVESEKFRHFCFPSGKHSVILKTVLDGLGIMSSTTTSQSIAYSYTDRQFLPRILDGEQLTSLELEAELCGVMDLLRSLRKVLKV